MNQHIHMTCYQVISSSWWEFGQSMASKDHGFQKYADIFGTYYDNSNAHEILYGEISYGPFHPNPDDHINEDNLRLGKFGKDRLDDFIYFKFQIKKNTYFKR